GRGGNGRECGADPRAVRRAADRADQAQHEDRHEDRRPDHRAPPGPGDRRGHARGDPGERPRAADLPRGVAMTPRAPLLAVEDLHTYYGEAHILQGVSMTVGEGEVVTLIGRSGAGKTTT